MPASALTGRQALSGRNWGAFDVRTIVCICATVGEIRKERYVDYHCAGFADKSRGNPTTCRR